MTDLNPDELRKILENPAIPPEVRRALGGIQNSQRIGNEKRPRHLPCDRTRLLRENVVPCRLVDTNPDDFQIADDQER